MRLLGLLLGFMLACSATLAFGTTDAEQADAYSVTTIAVAGDDATPTQIRLMRYALETDGFLVLKGNKELQALREETMEGVAQWYAEGVDHSDAILSLRLPDGTRRTTIAMDSRELESEKRSVFHDSKFSHIGFKMDKLRSILERYGRIVAKALDGGRDNNEPIFYATNNENITEYPSMLSVIEHGTHLDHLHIYETTNDANMQGDTLERHTDQGLFVAIIPAMTLSAENKRVKRHGDEFQVEVNGDMKTVHLPDDGVFFMTGDGLRSWTGHLKQLKQIPAVPHRLKMKEANRIRIWLGRMFFPPKDAFIAHQNAQFDQIRARVIMSIRNSQKLVAGCSAAYEELRDLTSEACKKDEMYCWMACRSTKDLHCSAQQSPKCVNQKTGEIWTDESKHCFDCTASCYPPSEPSQNDTERESSGQICNKQLYPTSMYMDGFTGLDRSASCLVFLFQGWILDTRFKYFLGCLGAFIIGFTTEILIYIRRQVRMPSVQRHNKVLASFPDRGKKRAHSGVLMFLYCLQLILAYWAMLLAMSFAVLIFSCVLIGLSCGHWIFNFRELPTTNEPCCNVEDQLEPLLDQTNTENGESSCCH